jgi:hypothetical protein
MQFSGRRGESSQNTRCGWIGLASFFDRASSTRHQRATSRSMRSRQARAQRLGAVADHAHLHRVADAQHARVDVDLHAARLAFLGQELGVRKARADHQQGVALLHQVPARLGAHQADGAGDVGQLVGHHVRVSSWLRRRRQAVCRCKFYRAAM